MFSPFVQADSSNLFENYFVLLVVSSFYCTNLISLSHFYYRLLLLELLLKLSFVIVYTRCLLFIGV